MESLLGSLDDYVPRPNEYERLAAYLLDQRFFLPVAISTSLKDGRGFGKTTLARAVCHDPRVKKAFAEGIIWVTLGHGLSPLELMARMEHLIFQLTGKNLALNDLDEAESKLHELLHPRRTLLVVDEADDEEALRPFLQAGPGGACLLISHDDSHVPVSARRVFVDIMMPDESAAMLVAGLPGIEDRSASPDSAGDVVTGAQNEWMGSVEPPAWLTGGASETQETENGTDTAVPEPAVPEPAETDWPSESEPTPDAAILAAERRALVLPELPPEVETLIEALADRLNEWPLLLALANGYMRGCFDRQDPQCSDLLGALQMLLAAIDQHGIHPGWRIDDPIERKRVLDSMTAACLEPFSLEERGRYLDLAVFPPDEALPLAALGVMWGLDEAAALDQVQRFERRALLQYDPRYKTIRIQLALHACLCDQLWAGQMARLHQRLVDAYQKKCQNGWASGPDDGYYFQHLVNHLMRAGRRRELQTLLFDFAWLVAFLNSTDYPGGRRGDMFALLSDFDVALSTALDNQSAELRLVQEALRLSAPALARDPHQLAPQLLGRLLPFSEPEIQALVKKATAWHEETWLRPLAACFTPPGSDEVRTLLGHADWVTGVAILPDGQHAISCSLDGALRLWDLANGQLIRAIDAHPDQVIFPNGLPGTGTLSDPRREAVDLEEKPRGTGALGSARSTGTLNPERILETMGTGSLAAVRGTGSLTPPSSVNPGGVSAVAITPDGQHAVTAGWDGAIRIWNLSTGQVEREIEAHIEPIGALVLTPDGKRIISGADDRLVRVWNLESGEKELEFVGHTDLVRTLAVTPDGRTVISGSWDSTLRLWDLETGELLHILTGHQGWVRSVTITPDGFHAISGAWDRTLRIWDLWTGETVRVLEGFRAPVFALVVTPDNRLIITGGGDGSVGLWDLETGKQLHQLSGHTGGVNAITLTTGGRFAVSASDDHTLRIWDLVAVQSRTARLGHEGPVHTLVGLPEGRTLLSASWDGQIKVWEPAAGRELRALSGNGGGVIALAVTSDGRTALAGMRDCTLQLWDVVNGKEIRTLAGHQRPVTTVSLTPDGRIAASGDDEGVLKIWDLTSGACLAEFHGEGAIWACAITPDGRTVTASESGGKMYFLEIET